jgi:5'-nucleotidase
MTRILVTNDDGVRSDGLKALGEALRPLGEVTIVAPTVEASAIGHALTLRRPLRLERVADRVFAVDGTPTDCVNIAVATVLKGLPSLIVSGINRGWNLGDDVTYSGTVSGALEGALLGVPSLAVSLQDAIRPSDFRGAARAAAIVARTVLRKGLPARTFLNINVPRGRTKGFRVTVQAKRNHVTTVGERRDPRGQSYFWIEEGQNEWEAHDRSDYQAVRDGYISVTPLQPDLTAYSVIPSVEEFSFTEARGTQGR